MVFIREILKELHPKQSLVLGDFKATDLLTDISSPDGLLFQTRARFRDFGLESDLVHRIVLEKVILHALLA